MMQWTAPSTVLVIFFLTGAESVVIVPVRFANALCERVQFANQQIYIINTVRLAMCTAHKFYALSLSNWRRSFR